MPSLRNIQMPQHCVTAVNGVQEPEVGYVHLSVSGLKGTCFRFRTLQRLLLLFQNLQQSSQQTHEPRTAGQLRAWRNKIGVINEVSGSVAPDTSDGDG